MVSNKATTVSNEAAIAAAKKWFPDLEITIVPALGNPKGVGNPKKVADMKRLLSQTKFPLPIRQ